MENVFSQKDIDQMDDIERERLARKLRESSARMLMMEFRSEPTQEQMEKLIPAVFMHFVAVLRVMKAARAVGSINNLKQLRAACAELTECSTMLGISAKSLREMGLKTVSSLKEFVSSVPTSELATLVEKAGGPKIEDWPTDLDSLFDDMGLDAKNVFNDFIDNDNKKPE